MIIAPSLLAADFTNLKNEIERLDVNGIQYLHLDIMDGVFVPNISFGFDIVSQLRPMTSMIFDMHLMLLRPIQYVEAAKNCGVDIFTFHIEAESDIQKTIDLTKKNNMKVGLSLNPNTNIEEIVPFLSQLDQVLIMSVNPGFGGQAFIKDVLRKVEFLKSYRTTNSLSFDIEIDGGINNLTAAQSVDAGCDILVAGSYVFNEEMTQRLKLLRGLNEVN